MIAWRPCPDFKAYECNADGDIQWKDGLHKGRGPVILYMVAPDKSITHSRLTGLDMSTDRYGKPGDHRTQTPPGTRSVTTQTTIR